VVGRSRCDVLDRMDWNASEAATPEWLERSTTCQFTHALRKSPARKERLGLPGRRAVVAKQVYGAPPVLVAVVGQSLPRRLPISTVPLTWRSPHTEFQTPPNE